MATPTGNWTDTNWDDDNPPTGANTGDFPTGGLSGNEAFVSGGQVNVTSSEGAFSLDIGNAFPGGMAVVAVQTGGTLSIQDSINIGVPGDLLIDGGTVNSFLINSTGQVIINNGGTLNADGALGTLEGPLNSVATINGNLTATQFNNYGGTLTLGTGSFTAASVILQNGGSGDPTFDVASGATMTLQNVVNGIGAGNFTKDGNGILNLDTANTYTGVTNIDDGTVSISNANSLGPNGSANTIVASGASLRLTGGSFNVNEAITINGGGNGDSDGALHSQGSNHDINGLITLGSGATIRKDGGGDLEIRGGIDTAGNQLRFENDDTVRVLGGGSVISGTGSVVKENNGTLELQNDNSYSGTTTINDGVVDIRTDMGLGTTAGNTNIDGDATLRLRGNLNSAENITLNGTANSGNGQNEGRIRNDDGDNILSGSIGWNDNSRVDVDSGTSLTLSGMVSGGGNIDKADTGRLAFSNPLNDFTGNVNVGAGTVAGSGNGSLGLANSITVANDATLEVGNVGTVASSLNVMGDGQAGVGVINNVAGDATFSGPVAAQGTSTTINGAANTNTTFTGAISLGVATDLTFNGDGNVTISQAFGNGAGPAELNALNAQFYDINGGDAQLNFQGTYSLNSNGTLTGVGGDLANTIDATSVQDFGPINYDRPGGSTSASGSDPYTFEALFSSLSGDPQEFQVVWVGEFVPDASGDYTFRTGDENLGGNPDDNGSIYVDLNQNGTFDSGEGTQSGSGIDVALTGFVAGERYTIAIGFNENGGDERFSASIQGSNGGSFTSETLIDPSSQSVFKATFDVDNNLIKNGTGLLRLDGDNTYNGTTEVNAGTLVINGDTSGQGSFNIDSGATLGGNGTIGLAAGESVNISGSPGTISPGDAGAGYAGPDPTFSMGTDAATVGTLTVDSTDPLFDPSSNSINLDGILQLDIVDPTTADMLVALQGIIDIDETTAMLNINGETDFSNLDFDAEMEDLFLVTSVDGINGNFNNTPLMDGAFEFSDIDGDSFALQFDGNNIILAAIAVPEPSTILIWTLLGLAAGGFAVRQRRRK